MAGTRIPDPAPWEWTEPKHRAAALVAADELTDQGIADKVGVARSTFQNWKKHPEFKTRVQDIAAELGAAAERYAIGRRVRRLQRLDETRAKLLQVIRERALDPAVANQAGGKTGLVVRTYKAAGRTLVEEYQVDVALLRELRKTEEQAARELGQWADRKEVSGPGGGAIHTAGEVVVIEMPDSGRDGPAPEGPENEPDSARPGNS
jgi:hypothetical protein